MKNTPSALSAKDTTASKTVTPLFRVQIKATKDVIYRVRNGADREYLVSILANGNTACVQCANDEPCPSTKTSGRKCYHIKECLKLEEARVTKSVQIVSSSCLENSQSMSTKCPIAATASLNSSSVAARWVEEELSSERLTREQYVALFDPSYENSCCYA